MTRLIRGMQLSALVSSVSLFFYLTFFKDGYGNPTVTVTLYVLFLLSLVLLATTSYIYSVRTNEQKSGPSGTLIVILVLLFPFILIMGLLYLSDFLTKLGF